MTTLLNLANDVIKSQNAIIKAKKELADAKLAEEEAHQALAEACDHKDTIIGNTEDGKIIKFAHRTTPGYNPETRKQGSVRKMKLIITDKI